MRVKRVFVMVVLVTAIALNASAQATRTWVSGVGDDVNPCSRTAPCKTFAGAISKTAAGGEISVLDPGGFGALTITKSITVTGADFSASALASAVNGFVINALSTDRVHLRKLTINGAGTTLGTNAIRVLSAARVAIEECNIENFGTSGIDVAPSTAITVRVAVSNTSIRNIAGHGVRVSPSGGATAHVSLDNVRISGGTTTAAIGSGSALFVDGGGSVAVNRSTFVENLGSGIFIRNSSDVTVMDSQIARNATGITVGNVNGGTARLFASNIYANSTGFAITAPGEILSHGNNGIAGNGGVQTPTSVINTQ